MDNPLTTQGKNLKMDTNSPIIGKYRNYLISTRDLSPMTLRNYVLDLKPFTQYLAGQGLFIDPPVNNLRKFIERSGIQKISSEYRRLVRDYVSWLFEQRKLWAGRRIGQRGHERASVIRNLAALRSFFRFLIDNDLVPDAPLWAPGSTLMRRFTPKIRQQLPRALTVGETARLMTAPEALIKTESTDNKQTLRVPQKNFPLRDKAILEILYSSGLRVNELIGLKIGDIEFNARTTRVIGKGLKTRSVPIGSLALDSITRYLYEERPQLAQKMSSGKTRTANGDNALFLNRYGYKLSARSVQNIVSYYALLAGLRMGVHPHTLRHSFATHLLDGGTDLRIVQELLGHSTPAATQIYTHVSKSEVKRVYLDAHPLAKRTST